MLKRYVCAVLALLLVLGCFAGCSEKPKQTEQSQKDDTSDINTEEVETLALELANAVMVYDLAVLQAHCVLDMQTQENVLKDILPYDASGKIDWDGIICDTYVDFVRVYDEHNEIPYQKLNVAVSKTEILDPADAADALAAADEREKLYREENAYAIHADAVAALEFDKVAVVDIDAVFQYEDRTQPGGEIETYQEQTATMQVILVRINGAWKSYSPTLVGTFPPLGHLPRYVTVDEPS